MQFVDYHVERLTHFHLREGVDPQRVAAQGQGEFVVEAIVAHLFEQKGGNSKNRVRFRIRWKGYEASEDTWHRWWDVRSLAALDHYLVDHDDLRRELRLRKVG